MNAHVISEVLIYLGVIGILQFVSLAFCARQLQDCSVSQLPMLVLVRVRKRMAGPAVRHAPLFAAASAVALLAGVVLGL